MDVNFDYEEQLEKLGKVPRGTRLIGVAGILLAVAVGYYFFSYQGALETLNYQRSQAQELQRKLTNVRAVANNVGEFEQEVAELERELHLALKQLPNRKQFEDLLQDITTAGKKVGVAIKSIQRTDERPHDFYAEVPFSITLEGSFHNIAMFFERVAKLPRIVNIGSMHIQVADKGGDQTLLRVEGSATTFRFLRGEERA